ncbi:ribosomal protein S5 domain 2-like protein [Laetiporus sulphureus 93-53]|uniref:Small ribosomal subunit protein uS9m n=1 Tax=Laetiporus sulphureus 93-53 TaxID=1314785 RepID=A0A165GXI1_9APHY|nr:ribosomal protein S5 domain 2-like protein [Laetiporus sulphureus 93-53]KZT10962.1 ribosomal protein S5 domain 2-like protein [Laetiporus sulphureus 93-53]
MNIARARNAIASAVRSRSYTTMYVPPASLENVAFRRAPRKPVPESPNFYTGRATYYDQIAALETAIQSARSALQILQLLPLPVFARAAIPPARHVWLTKDSLAQMLHAPVKTSRYRRLVGLLNQLDEYKRIAEVAGVDVLAENVHDILALFERANKEAVLAHGKQKPVKFDEYGRSYTIGRRKESTARVWVIAAQNTTDSSSASSSTSLDTETPQETIEHLPEPTSTVISAVDHSPIEPVKVTTTNILVNSTPLVQYFPNPADRERIVRPFRLTGLVGAYNVFALVRGGGTTGQSGAVSLGIAKALVAHAPDVESLLKKAKLLRRDPRMVERKKTGLAKARKAYTWVKR